MEFAPESNTKTLKNRANAKFLTQELIQAIIEIRGAKMVDKHFARALGCATFIKIADNGITSRFCENRFCLVCNRIRTAQLFQMYGRVITDLPDLYFVTLTIKNPVKKDLSPSIKLMYKRFAWIKDLLRKQKIKLLGLRKLEITYNDRENTYHPHYHLIISGQYQAEHLVDYWLKYNKESVAAAQDMRKADEKALKELFKYFTKLKSNNSYSEKVTISALNHIINCVKGVRIFQPIGIKAEKLPEKTHQVSQGSFDPTYWDWGTDNWYNEAGEPLIANFKIYDKALSFSQNFDYIEV
jgi:plasmid rolling circle replication initiator protein Rep